MRSASRRRGILPKDLQSALLRLQVARGTRSFLRSAIHLLRVAAPADAAYVMLHCYGRIGRTSEAWGTDGRRFDENWLHGHHAANPTLPLLRAHPGRKLLTLGQCYDDDARLLRSRFYQCYLKPRGSRYAAGLFFWNDEKESVDCALTLHRGKARTDFTADEVKTLEQLHPHIEVAFRRIARQQNESCARESLEHFLSELPVPTILLDWQLRPLYHNAAAREAVNRWSGGDRHCKLSGSFRIPDDLEQHLDVLRRKWSSSLRESPMSRTFKQQTVTHPNAPGLRALLSMTALRSANFGKPSFVIRFEQTHRPAERRLSALTRLTTCERELASLVCEGRSNQEIAEKVGRSVSTVKSELYSVFQKLGVASRGKLAALVR